ncbi:MAG: YggT family protein [Rhizobiaceae bacterium]
MRAILEVILLILDLYWWIVIASVIFSWLYAFNVINAGNPFVGSIGNFLHQATDPLLRRIRQIMPSLGSLDVSPIVLILGIFFIRRVIVLYVYPNVY